MVASRSILVCLAFGAVAALATAAASAQVVPDALPINSLQLVARTASQISPATPIRRALQQTADSALAEGADGEEDDAPDAKTKRWMYIHAVLMSLAWVGLLPLGILLAQSRWAKPLRNAVVGKKGWFWLHMGINISGVALVITAFAIAVSPSTGMNIEAGDGSTANAHKALGCITFALLLLQLVAAFVQPHPHIALRGVWNTVHHNLGRVVILVAWATMWLGVAIGHEDLPGSSLARWLAPIAAAQFIIFMAYLLNQGLKKRTFREEETEEKWQSTLAERDASYGRMVVTAGAPAGSLSDSAGSSAAGNVPGDIYGSSIRATARVAYPTVRVG